MGRVVIDEERCKGCELCATACPRRLLVVSNRLNSKGYRPVAFEPEAEHSVAEHPFPSWRESTDVDRQCTGCALCARMCPDVAITVYSTRQAPNHDQGT